MNKKIFTLVTTVTMSVSLFAGSFNAVYAVDETETQLLTEFNQTFENPAYQTKKPITLGRYYMNNTNLERTYINNADDVINAFAANTLYIYQGDMYDNQYNEDGSLNLSSLANITRDQKISLIQNDTTFKNARRGGLDGYLGLTTNIGPVPAYCAFKNGGQEIYPFMVRELPTVKSGSILKLFVCDTSYGMDVSMFGKEKMDLYHKKTYISFMVRPDTTFSSPTKKPAITLSLTKNLGDVGSKVAEQNYFNYTSKSNWLLKTRVPNGGITDAITFSNGGIYIGLANEENKICDYAQWNWHRVDVCLDYTKTTAPTVAATVYKGDGTILGTKTGYLPVSDTDVTRNVSITNDLFSDRGKNDKMSFNAAEPTDEYGYGVYLKASGDGTDNQYVYIDDFSLTQTAEDEWITGEVWGNKVTAKLHSVATITDETSTTGKISSGVLVAAVYDKTSGALTGLQKVDIATNKDYAATQEFDFGTTITDNSKVKLLYWNDLGPSINPICPSVTVK